MKLCGLVLCLAICAVYSVSHGHPTSSRQPSNQQVTAVALPPQAHTRQKRGLLLGLLGAKALGGAALLGAGALGIGALGAGALGAGALGGAVAGGLVAKGLAHHHYGGYGHEYYAPVYEYPAYGYVRSYPTYIVEDEWW